MSRKWSSAALKEIEEITREMDANELQDAFDCAFKALNRQYKTIHYADKNGNVRTLVELPKSEYDSTIAYLKKNGYKEGRDGVWRKVA